VSALYERFAAEEVDLYLAALIAMEPDTWSDLASILERRRQA